MPGLFRDPADLARALLAGPVTPERIRKLLRHARRGTRTQFAQVLAALPETVRPQVETAGAAVTFRG